MPKKEGPGQFTNLRGAWQDRGGGGVVEGRGQVDTPMHTIDHVLQKTIFITVLSEIYFTTVNNIFAFQELLTCRAEKNRFLGAQKFVLLKASSVEHYAPHNFVQLVTLRVTRGTRNIDITLVSLLLTLKRFYKFS